MNKMENIKITGEMNFKLYDEKGVLKDESTHKNLIVNGGRDYIFSQIGDTGNDSNFKYIGVGTDNTTPAATQTSLEAEVGTRGAHTYAHSAGTTTMTATYTFAAGNATGTIQEAGLFTASSAGTMLNRVNGINKVKGAGDSLQVTYTLTIATS